MKNRTDRQKTDIGKCKNLEPPFPPSVAPLFSVPIISREPNVESAKLQVS